MSCTGMRLSETVRFAVSVLAGVLKLWAVAVSHSSLSTYEVQWPRACWPSSCGQALHVQQRASQSSNSEA